MTSISVGDLTGNVQNEVYDNTYLAQNQLASLKTSASILKESMPVVLANLGTNGFPATFTDATFGESFTNPASSVLGNTLTPGSSVNSAIAIYGTANSPLFGSDDYDADVTIDKGQFWASFEIDTLLDLQAAIPVGAGGFGVTVEGSTTSTFYTYCEAAENQPRVTLEQTFQDALNAFSIPLSSKDVLAMKPAGSTQQIFWAP